MRKSLALVALAAASALLFSGCSAPATEHALVPGSALSIGEAGSLVSLNAGLAVPTGSQHATTDLAALTLPAFYQQDSTGQLAANTSFGTVTRHGNDVTYTLTGNAKWSDSVPVSLSDLAVSYLAATSKLQPGYNSVLSQSSLALATGILVSGKQLTIHYSQPVPDWQTNLPLTVPAHLLAQKAVPAAGLNAADAEQVVLDAATGANQKHLQQLADTFTSLFNLPSDGSTIDKALVLTAGAYKIASVTPQQVLLTADKAYTAGPKATVAKITLNCYSSADELATAITAKQVDLAVPVASTMNTLAALESQAAKAGMQSKAGDAGREQVALLNYGSGSVFASDTWKGNPTKLKAAREGFFQFLPRAGIWNELAGDSSRTKSNSLVFATSDSNYQASVNQNGTSAYPFQNAEGSAEMWQAAGFDRTLKVRVLFDSNDAAGQLEFTQLSKLGKLGGFDLENVSSDNPSAVLASGQWDVYLAQQGNLLTDKAALATVIGAETGFKNPAASKIAAKVAAGTNLASDTVDGKNLDQVLVQNYYGLPLFQLQGLVVWSSKLQNYSPTLGSQSVAVGYSNWVVGASAK